MRLASIVSITVLAVACSMSACGGSGDGDGASPSATVATERPTSSAELSIASPRNGEHVTGDSVRLEIDLQGAEVVDQTSTDLRPDEGHLHVMLDGTLVSMTSGTSMQLADLTPGEHLLQVEFVANDHAPFDPRVLAAVTFEVRP